MRKHHIFSADGLLISEVDQPFTEDEIRNHRDNLLQQTDWMALSDVTMTPEWAAYRQALRDVTAQEGYPYAVIWPTKPE